MKKLLLIFFCAALPGILFAEKGRHPKLKAKKVKVEKKEAFDPNMRAWLNEVRDGIYGVEKARRYQSKSGC